MDTNTGSRGKILTYIYIIIIAIAIVGGVWYFVFSSQSSKTTTDLTTVIPNSPTTTEATTSTASTTKIENESGLISADSDLDSTNLDDIDSSLSQNDTESAEF